jgi:hypothetical protein
MPETKIEPPKSEAVVDTAPIGNASYTSILEEHNVADKQRKVRKEILERLEKKEFNGGCENNAVIAHIAKEGSMGSSLESSDVPVLGNLLRSIGDADADKKADKVVKMLSSVKQHKVHGRLIDGQTARTELGLKVKMLAKDDPLWQNVWEYYTRSEINMGRANSPKMFETRHEMLIAQHS